MNILFLKLVEMYTLEIMAINLLAVTSHYSTNKTRTKNKAFCYYIYFNEYVYVFSLLALNIFFFQYRRDDPRIRVGSYKHYSAKVHFFSPEAAV